MPLSSISFEVFGGCAAGLSTAPKMLTAQNRDDGLMDLKLIAHRGVFSTANARSFGITPTSLRSRVANAECFRLHHGWYSVRPPVDERDRHWLRLSALLQEYAGLVVASHGSALVWLGLPTERVDLGTVHLMWRAPDKPFRSFSRTNIHEVIERADLPSEDETVAPALAVVQAGLADQRSLLVAGDAALRSLLATTEHLRCACRALKGQRGVTAARAAVEWCDARHESPGETLTAHVMRMLGYRLQPQFPVPGTAYRADFLIEGTTVLLEFDGRLKYDSDEARFAEKVREDAIRSLGYEVVRITWAMLREPEKIRRLVEAAVRRSLMRSA
jgi:very-short-patch-repair endonuclease